MASRRRPSSWLVWKDPCGPEVDSLQSL
jgi:hypothetical protein